MDTEGSAVKSDVRKIVIPISGMHCVMCARSIENALMQREGVIDANVNFATEKAVIEYDPSRVALDELGKVIREVGYEPVIARKDAERREVIMQIVGMTCASCAATVEKALSSLEGVESAVVNIATEKARVKYDPSVVSILDLRQAVKDVGYDVETEEEVD
ncbi:heavy metal translocating P-type ATPase, partial [Candidatus Bathyarchaeota archaeon]